MVARDSERRNVSLYLLALLLQTCVYKSHFNDHPLIAIQKLLTMATTMTEEGSFFFVDAAELGREAIAKGNGPENGSSFVVVAGQGALSERLRLININ
jgi:hypothetical protein